MSFSHDDETFSRQPQIALTAELTPEQRAWFSEWDAAVPTIYFLDICVVNIIKMSGTVAAEDPRKAAWLEEFRHLDRPQHAFSYLLTLFEKASDPRPHLPEPALAAQIRDDLASLRAFFGNARVYETDAMLDQFLGDLRGNPIEILRPNYLAFLKAANDEFKLSDPVAPKLRFARAREIIKRAETLGVPRQHITVVAVLACLYGNPFARKVLKFRPDPARFAAENALADLMLIRRFMERKLEIEQMGSEGASPYRRAKLVTDDEGVLRLARFFEPLTMQTRSGDKDHETRLATNVQFRDLLTGLVDDDEYDRLCALIFGDAG